MKQVGAVSKLIRLVIEIGLGVVGGVFFTAYFDDSSSVLLAIVILIVTLIFILTQLEAVQNQLNPESDQSPLFKLFKADDGVFRKIDKLDNHLSDGIKDLNEKLGITVQYVPAPRQPGEAETDNNSEVFNASMEIIMKAEQRILVCNSFSLYNETEVGASSEAAKRYLQAILDLALGRKKILYERVLQYAPDANDRSRLDNFVDDPIYMCHFRKMIEAHRSNIKLIPVKGQRLSTFVIVDKQYLIWQINKLVVVDPGAVHERDRYRTKMHGVFVITDPHGEFIKHFETHFDQIKEGKLFDDNRMANEVNRYAPTNCD